MTVLNPAASPRLVEAMNDIKQLTLAERLMLARLLLDSVLTSETDDDADWLNLGLGPSLRTSGTIRKTPSTTTGEHSMAFRRGDVVLIPFPFTDFSAAKTRPVTLFLSSLCQPAPLGLQSGSLTTSLPGVDPGRPRTFGE